MPSFEKWDLWYTTVRFEDDASQEKERPAIVISVGKNKATGLYVTSSSPRPGFRDYPIKEWKAAGLTKQSTVRLDRVVPLNEIVSREKIGTLDRYDIMILNLWLSDATKVFQAK